MSSATLSELIDELDQATNSGIQIVLPNARAAQALRFAFDARQTAHGFSAWQQPRVLSWTQWMKSLWSELVVAGVETRLLLNTAQEHDLWRGIVAGDVANSSPGSADSLAELAQSAWQIAAEYNATGQLREFATTHDSRIFAAWAQEFVNRCAADRCLSAALLNDALLNHAKAGTLAVSNFIELVGFYEMSASQQCLIAGLRDCGTGVTERRLEATKEPKPLRSCVVAESEREELQSAARWIRSFLEKQEAEGNRVRVAVLVPNLSEDRAELDDTLRETLAPELQWIGTDLSLAPWEFSAGVALSSIAIVADALTLARWANGPLPITQVSSLLLSPYMGLNASDGRYCDTGARFDVVRLRRTPLLRWEIDLPGLLELAESDREAEPANGQALLPWLRPIESHLLRAFDRNRLRSFAEWMEFFRSLTKAAGWPGDRVLTPSEFEATRAWESMLDLLSTLDFSGRRVPFADALQALELQARKTMFAPPFRDASVQVMSIAEAEGLAFDAVLFLRATDANWPATERTNPLLSWTLQRHLKMPGSDPAIAAARSRAFMEDLLRRSGTVLFSYAAEDTNGRLRPSPLLAEIGIEKMSAEELFPPAQPFEPIDFEKHVDEISLPMLPSHEVAGGASVLKLQATCGFLAFAQLRLRAQEPQTGDIGLDAGESGSLLHRTLQHFWKVVETQDALRSLSWMERDRILVRSIEEALPRRLRTRDDWDHAYLDVQKERLRRLLQRWMEEELKRGPFKVLAMEQDQELTIGPLTLSVRMDRVDSVEGGVFFVDYKTGYAADPKQWAGPRPDDPQLPLYTLLPEADELKGVAFAKVRTGSDMKWLGYQLKEGILPQSRSKANIRDLPSLVEEWRSTLTTLAQDFAAGRADVHPKSFEENCKRCAQRLLCRVDPAIVLATLDEDDAFAEGVNG